MERSGLTQREFAARHGLSLFTLRKWVQLADGSMASAAPGFWQELSVPNPSASPRWAAELVRPDGVVLRVTAEAPADLVAALWRVATC